MARSVTAEAEDFARFFFRLVEEQGGAWVTGRDVLEQAVAAYPTHPFVDALEEKPSRRALFTTAAERIREAEFPQVEKRKAGARRNAPVQYRAPASAPQQPPESAPEATGEAGPTPAGHAIRRAAGLPACVTGHGTPALRFGADEEPRLRLGAGLCLGETRPWWWRLLEPVLRVIDRVHAVLAGR